MDNRRLLLGGEIAVNSEAFKNLTILCDKFGSRFFATEEERAASNFLAKRFRQYGLHSVEVEPATLLGWEDGNLTEIWNWARGTAALDLLAPTHKELSCISLVNAPSTSDEGLTAEIFNLERGSRSYLIKHKSEIRGKIVLVGSYSPSGVSPERDESNLYYTTIYGYLERFGASGMVFVNPDYGDLLKTGAARFAATIGEIPACGVSRETSHFILRQMNKGPVTVNLRIENKYVSGATIHNVVAEIPGDTHPSEVILVGGHYDSFDVSPGAMDDAAGACVVLEAARALAKYGGSFKRTIRFCCFAGEENGLNGSTGYVLNHRDETKNIRLMINTDAAGISAKTGHSFEVCGPKEMVSYLDDVLNELGVFDRNWEVPTVTYKVSPYSDHWPFFMVGIPAAHFRDIPADPVDFIYSHTSADTVDKVDSKGLKDAALILALVLMKIADSSDIPVPHTPIREIIRAMEEKGISENLRVEKRWGRELPTVRSNTKENHVT